MTGWGRDVRVPALDMLPAPTQAGVEPRILPATRREVRASVVSRIAAYTSEWTNRRSEDAGVALVNVHGTLSEAARIRLNRIPRALLLDHIGIAGVRPLPARPVAATLAVEVGETAPASLSLPPGTPFAVPGGDVPVLFETLDPVDAAPGRVAAVAVSVGGLVTNDTPDDLGAGLHAFGDPPEPRGMFWIGVESPVTPGPTLSLAIALVPPPTRPTANAGSSRPADPPPVVRWEAMVAGTGVQVAVEHDGTGGLVREGVVRLRTPEDWAPGTLPGRDNERSLLWIRAVLVTAAYPHDARVASVALNGVRAHAARTVRGEVAVPVARGPGGRARYALSQTPIVRGSVVLEVFDAAADVFGLAGAGPTIWKETDDLASQPPDAAVFLLDPASGQIEFGDGIHGRAVPEGFRHVVARSYAVGGGTVATISAGDRLTPQRSVSGLDGARVLRRSRGADEEALDELLLRGPEMIRSRQRAVLPADYAAMALTTESVEIARAHCLPGRDPRYPGGSFPGVVGVIVVPEIQAAKGPPVPDQPTLQAVSEHLANRVGVIGAEVVVAGPRYRRIVAHAVLVARVGTDLAAVTSDVRDRIDKWLDPLQGGLAGTGWVFGSPVRSNELTRLLLDEFPDLIAVSSLAFSTDGRRLTACADVALEDDELTWPGIHRLQAVVEEAVA